MLGYKTDLNKLKGFEVRLCTFFDNKENELENSKKTNSKLEKFKYLEIEKCTYPWVPVIAHSISETI